MNLEGSSGAAGDSYSAVEDFEFEDAAPVAGLTPRSRLGGQRELKGSARKKKTDFKNVVSNMKRHQQMDAANRAKAAAKASGAATDSAKK